VLKYELARMITAAHTHMDEEVIASTDPPGACLSPRPPFDLAQTHVAGGSWMLVSDIGALPVLPGAALWPLDQVYNRTSRNRRYDSFSFNGTQTYSRRVSRDTVDPDRPNTTAIRRTDHPTSTPFSI